MKLAAICMGQPEILPGRSYRTGINKMAVNIPMMVDAAGLVGDSVLNRKHHGGPDQAILLEGSLTIDWWAEQLGRDLPAGIFGENLRIEGLDSRDVCIGDRFVFADVVLQATAPRTPCATLLARMGEPGFVRRYFAARRPGIYCRVLHQGMLAPGEVLQIEPYEPQRIPAGEVLAALGGRVSAADRTRFLALPIAERLHRQFTAS